MSAVNYVADDFAAGILDYDSVVECIICEDCDVPSEQCPEECLNIHCPRHNKAEGLIDDIVKVLNSYGIY